MRLTHAVLVFGMMVGCGGGEGIGQSKQATTPWGVSFTILGRGTYDAFNVHRHDPGFDVKLKSKQPLDVVSQTVTFEPGGFSGWHTHLGPVYISVIEGAVRSFDGSLPGCPYDDLSAGQGVVEAHESSFRHMVKNYGTVEAKLLVTYLIPVGTMPRIDTPDPNNPDCPNRDFIPPPGP